jgi:dipeptidyl aminopeptidase/acylaminoacyl peptidase
MRIRYVGLALGFALLSWAHQGIAAPPPPAAAFAALPAIRNVALSPGGKMLAWFDSTSGAERIVMYDVVAQKERRVLGVEPQMTFRWLGWSDDSTLLYNMSETQTVPARGGLNSAPDITREIYRIFATDVDSPAIRLMLKSDPDLMFMTGVQLIKLHTTKPNTIVIGTYNWSQMAHRMQTGTSINARRAAEGWVHVTYEVDTHTGKSTRLDVGDQYTDEWLVNAEGKVVGRGEWNAEDQSYTVLVKRGLQWSAIYQSKRPAALPLVGLSADQSAILAVDKDTDGRTKLWAMPLDGSPRKLVLADPNGDVTGIVSDPYNGAPLGAWIGGASYHQVWFDQDTQHRREVLSRSFPHQEVSVVAESTNKQLTVARVSSPSNPATYYLIDLSTHRASSIGTEYPKLADVKLGEVVYFTYKAHDGTDIPGFLTLPPDAPHAALPLVVLPHGGPASYDRGDDFEWLRQFLATRGYAVFQPQFRGSGGFGEKFRLAGERQWGLLMQDDITDGVHALIDRGQADPHRICIVGYAYGAGYSGYAALAGAAYTPELYKCAVSVNGVSDLPRFLGFQIEKAGEYSNDVAYWRATIGGQSDANVLDRSPDRAADRFAAPVLLIYSAGDAVVPPNQSTLMAESLQKAGKSVQLVELPGEDHGLSHSTTRLSSLEQIEKFLQDHL